MDNTQDFSDEGKSFLLLHAADFHFLHISSRRWLVNIASAVPSGSKERV